MIGLLLWMRRDPATGAISDELKAQTHTGLIEAAFIELLPGRKKKNHQKVIIPPRDKSDDNVIPIEAQDLTMRFGQIIMAPM
ncbi:hypothetical protein AB6H17_07280 [Proteus vulgaris]|uniref:hypothetical protein n=1 Tax=Proteus vulgaris TaxID=585 RepID=UPI0034DD2A4B